jgi:hypothetical protein
MCRDATSHSNLTTTAGALDGEVFRTWVFELVGWLSLITFGTTRWQDRGCGGFLDRTGALRTRGAARSKFLWQ